MLGARHLLLSWLAIAASVLVFAACESSQPVPEVTVAAEPAASPETTHLTARGYGAACGRLVDGELDVKTQGAETFRERAEALASLVPPPELQDFHEAQSQYYLSQVEAGDTTVDTQAAWDRQLVIVGDMPTALRQMLVDEYCLLELQVRFVDNTLAARERVTRRGPATADMSIEEYAERCADIKRTAPVAGSLDDFLTYVSDEWRKLVPPQILEDYHSAIQAVYAEMLKSGGVVDEASPAFQYAAAEGKKLGVVILDKLMRAGCIGE